VKVVFTHAAVDDLRSIATISQQIIRVSQQPSKDGCAHYRAMATERTTGHWKPTVRVVLLIR